MIFRYFLPSVFLLLSYNFCLSQSRDLNFYLNTAIQNSPLLKDYQNQILRNRLDSMIIRAALRPQVTGTAAAYYPPVINGYGYDPAITNYGSYSALIGIKKDFVGAKELSFRYHAASFLNDSILFASKISEQELKKTIIGQYITAYGDGEQLQYQEELLQFLGDEDAVLKKITEQNAYRQIDYLAFHVSYQQQQLQLKQLKIQHLLDYYTLNYLSGLNDTSIIPLTAPALEELVSISSLPTFNQSLFYKPFLRDSLALQYRDRQIDFVYRPRFSLFGDAGYQTSFTYHAEKNFGASIGANLSIPIYDGKQRKLLHDKILLQEKTRTYYRDFFISQYNQQINLLRQQLRSVEELISEYQDQLKFSEGLIEANKKLLASGDVRVSDFLLAINNYMTTKNSLLQFNINRYQVINQINYWNRPAQ